MSYYELLEVNKNASETEIKKAYRRKSLHYHPDRNGTSEALNKMKEINEAYGTLSDKSKRRQYDLEEEFGENPFGFFSQAAGMPFMRQPNMNEPNIDVNDLFSSLFGNMMNVPMGHEMPNIRVFHGVPPEHLFSKQMNQYVKPESLSIHLDISLEQAYNGCTLPVKIERWVMIGDTKITEEETTYVNIYQGIDDNEIITLDQKGNISSEQIKGDVKITININNDSYFSRNGLDLLYNKKISLKEALCGFSFDLEHINNKKLAFNNKNNISVIKPSFSKKIPNMGMKRDNNTGNLIVTFEIDFPDKLTSEQIEQLQSIL